MSATTHSLHVFLPLPFFIPPITSKFLHLETQSLSSLRSTCPNHLNLPRLTTLSTPSIPNPCLSSSLVLLSFRVTPDIHLTILFSVLTSLCISSTFIGQVSLPYTRTLCTHALYIFPFTLKEALLVVSSIFRSLNFPQAHLTLALDDSSAPPPFPITSPRQQNFSTTSNLSLAPNTNCFVSSTAFPPPPQQFLHMKPSTLSNLPRTPLHLLCIHILQDVHILNSHPPLFYKFHKGICPSSPLDLHQPYRSLPLSYLYSPEVPSPSISSSTPQASSPAPP